MASHLFDAVVYRTHVLLPHYTTRGARASVSTHVVRGVWDFVRGHRVVCVLVCGDPPVYRLACAGTPSGVFTGGNDLCDGFDIWNPVLLCGRCDLVYVLCPLSNHVSIYPDAKEWTHLVTRFEVKTILDTTHTNSPFLYSSPWRFPRPRPSKHGAPPPHAR